VNNLSYIGLDSLLVLRDIGFAFVVAVGFAILFNAPLKVLWVAGLLGGLGHALRFFLHDNFGVGIILATLAGTVLIGIAGIWLAHKVHTPPDVFTIPACITMIPGLFAYRTMLGFIKIADDSTPKKDPAILVDTAHNFVLTSSLLFALAIGICIGALLFRQKSAKHITFRRRRKV
jgi:uncharacterized membrane protein YjjB (DUF3815 family)